MSMRVICSASPEPARRMRSGLASAAFRVTGQFVEAEGDSLSEVHRETGIHGGDAHEPVAVAHVVVGEAELLGAEQQGDGGLRQAAGDQARAILQAADGMLEFPMTDGGGAHNQAAIGDGLGDARELLGRLEQGRRADRRARLAKSHVVGVDHAQAGEAEVGHGTCRRSDVERVARGNQDDAEVVFPGRSHEH